MWKETIFGLFLSFWRVPAQPDFFEKIIELSRIKSKFSFQKFGLRIIKSAAARPFPLF